MPEFPRGGEKRAFIHAVALYSRKRRFIALGLTDVLWLTRYEFPARDILRWRNDERI
jgi:hypothetical protein